MDRVKTTVVAVTVLLTTAIAVPALLSGVAAAQETQQVDSCTTIAESGEYELSPGFGETNDSAAENDSTAENESGVDETDAQASDETNDATNATANDSAGDANACIVIEANDVDLDGNGTVLDGDNVTAQDLAGNGSVDGLNASTVDNTTVAADASDDSISNATELNATELNATAITVRPAAGTDTVSNVTIRNVTLRNWHIGLSLQNVSGVTLDGVVFRNNTVSGFEVSDTTDMTVEAATETETAAD